MTIFASIKSWAKAIKRDVIALWIASRDPRVPWSAKAVAACVAAYALSPIDLIPDVIPVLGLLDDLLIVPLGIWLAVRLIPAPLMTEFRLAALAMAARPRSMTGAGIVIAVWIVAAVLVVYGLWRLA